MSGTLTQYGRLLLLKGVFQNDLFTAPTQLYAGLAYHPPAPNSTVDQIDEPVGNNYSRPPYYLGSNYWATTEFAEMFNMDPVTWPVCNTNPWGLMRGWFLADGAGTGANVVAVGPLSQPWWVAVGTNVQLGPQQMLIGLYD